MAHSLSAKKRIRQNVKRHAINRAWTGATKKQIKSFLKSTTTPGIDIQTVEQELRTAQKKIDQLAARGIIHRNTAARRKSGLFKKLNTLKAKANA